MQDGVILAFDPGKTGGWAHIQWSNGQAMWFEAGRMPVKSSNLIDVGVLVDQARRMPPDMIVLERQWIRPRDSKGNGGTTMRLYGMLQGFACLNAGLVFEVDPATWKKATGVTSEKSTSLEAATALFPAHRDNWKFASVEHGVAEAALINRYAALTILPGIEEKEAGK